MIHTINLHYNEFTHKSVKMLTLVNSFILSVTPTLLQRGIILTIRVVRRVISTQDQLRVLQSVHVVVLMLPLFKRDPQLVYIVNLLLCLFLLDDLLYTNLGLLLLPLTVVHLVHDQLLYLLNSDIF